MFVISDLLLCEHHFWKSTNSHVVIFSSCKKKLKVSEMQTLFNVHCLTVVCVFLLLLVCLSLYYIPFILKVSSMQMYSAIWIYICIYVMLCPNPLNTLHSTNADGIPMTWKKNECFMKFQYYIHGWSEVTYGIFCECVCMWNEIFRSQTIFPSKIRVYRVCLK